MLLSFQSLCLFFLFLVCCTSNDIYVCGFVSFMARSHLRNPLPPKPHFQGTENFCFKGRLNFIKCFLCIYWIIIWFFFLYSVNMNDIDWFSNDKSILHSLVNAIWSWCVMSLQYIAGFGSHTKDLWICVHIYEVCYQS